MKIQHWICGCEEGRILEWDIKTCEICHHDRGSQPGNSQKYEVTSEKGSKKQTKKEIIEQGEIYYELQIELGVGPDIIAKELSKNYSDVWYATYQYKKFKGILQ